MILGRMAHNEDVPRPSPRKGARSVFAGFDRGQVRGLSRDARRRAQQAPPGGTARLAAFASDPPVRRSSCFAPRPDRGGTQRSQAAPGGDEHNWLSSTQGRHQRRTSTQACAVLLIRRVPVHGFRRGTPVRSKSSSLRVTTQRSCRTGRRHCRKGPLPAGDSYRKATREPAPPPQLPNLTCEAFPCSADLIP